MYSTELVEKGDHPAQTPLVPFPRSICLVEDENGFYMCVCMCVCIGSVCTVGIPPNVIKDSIQKYTPLCAIYHSKCPELVLTFFFPPPPLEYENRVLAFDPGSPENIGKTMGCCHSTIVQTIHRIAVLEAEVVFLRNPFQHLGYII